MTKPVTYLITSMDRSLANDHLDAMARDLPHDIMRQVLMEWVTNNTHNGSRFQAETEHVTIPKGLLKNVLDMLGTAEYDASSTLSEISSAINNLEKLE